MLSNFSEFGFEFRIDSSGTEAVELLLKRCTVFAVAALSEQVAHAVSQASCVGDAHEGITFIDFTCGEAGELLALELPAAHGALLIHGAAETFQRGAGLFHPDIAVTVSDAQANGSQLSG